MPGVDTETGMRNSFMKTFNSGLFPSQPMASVLQAGTSTVLCEHLSGCHFATCLVGFVLQAPSSDLRTAPVYAWQLFNGFAQGAQGIVSQPEDEWPCTGSWLGPAEAPQLLDADVFLCSSCAHPQLATCCCDTLR